ncbi:hypothetical protein H9L19_06650 [Weissella diestrammenae]|uniref:ImmA/IrrE family metallo-endopeptidase n=1 Tax=Weissella diestrammenae TaxID=1162633 RepID=A0A7G9T4M9_9LACO|nr:hypothetical protein [Weissella diestrammenae]MCM0582153.1 hypothetical protein [Weissella diestrammenae]QNN75054.1 hypothetical protein H9L19_06650 [Weissella diestrammenae]
MTSDLIDYLLTYCINKKIDVKFTNKLDESTPDICYPKHRKIIINKNYNTIISIAFRLAHEMSHILYGDSDAQGVYAFSPLSKKFEERLAHENGIELIARYVYSDTPVENRNYLNFMYEFGLPSSFENTVSDIVKKI